MKYPILAICTLFIGITASRTIQACSAFSLHNGAHYTAYSFDGYAEHGYILVNPRNVKKTAVEVKNPVSWTSKYGSCTFTQYGREFPFSGMNESGLVVEVLSLNKMQPVEPSDTLKSIDNIQWVQYQLDNAADVSDVSASVSTLRIIPITSARVHYYITDRSGAAMVVEITGKQQHCYPLLDDLKKCITNSTFEDSKRFLETTEMAPSPSDISSRARLQRLSHQLKQYSAAKRFTTDDMFTILQSVKKPGRTQWNIVYNHDTYTIHFKTASNPKIRTLNLKTIDFTCRTPINGADIMASTANNAEFKPFTMSDNMKLMTTSNYFTQIYNIGAKFCNEVSSYLETFVCQ